MARRLTYDEVRKAFENRGCTLISQEYRRAKDKLQFICVCGRSSEIAYDKFSIGQLCRGCRGERTGKAHRHTLEYVRDVFNKNGCTLLATSYTGNKEKLPYICSCGNRSEIAFAKFQSGQRCSGCKGSRISEKISGPNNYMWNPNLTKEDRVKERKIEGYVEWRRSVFERDGYSCVVCGVGGRMNAHHIESYARVPEKRLDIDNGVTLCVDCHREYHKKILHNDATEDSFHFFIGEYREPWYAGELLDDVPV